MSEIARNIVYVVSKWNQETETFVRREVAAALAAGSRIQVVSLRSPAASDGIVDDRRIRIIVPSTGMVLGGAWWALRFAPVRTLLSLLRILRLGRGRTVVSHLAAWAAAIAVAPTLYPADVVLSHFAWVSSTVADTLGNLRRTPYAIFVHAHDVYERRCQDRYLTDRLRRAAVVFVESERIQSDIGVLHGVDSIVMPMGVSEDFVIPEDEIGQVDGGSVVVSVGALRKKKGHDLLIEAVSGLDGAHLRIAGEGPERKTLEELAARLGHQDRIDLLGHCSLDDVKALLDEASVFCLASRVTSSGDRDGVPNVLIEAMARGVPVVATDVSGIPDLLDDGCGLIVPPDDVRALRSAISELLDDGEKSKRIASRALRRIRDEYTTRKNWVRLARALPSAGRLEPANRHSS